MADTKVACQIVQKLLRGLPPDGSFCAAGAWTHVGLQQHMRRGGSSRGEQFVSFLVRCFALQPVQKIGGALRVRGSGENGPLVFLQHLQPVRQIGRMVLAHLRRHAERGAEESGTQFGHQLLKGVGLITEALAKLSRHAALMARPADKLVRLDGGVALRIPERLGSADPPCSAEHGFQMLRFQQLNRPKNVKFSDPNPSDCGRTLISHRPKLATIRQ